MLNDLIPQVFEVLEQTTPRYTAQILDDTGVALPAASLSTLTLSLYTLDSTGTAVYIRNAQNVLNANNVTVDTNGNIVWSVQVADTTLANTALDFERHIALWTWTWSGGLKTGRHEVILNVKNVTTI